MKTDSKVWFADAPFCFEKAGDRAPAFPQLTDEEIREVWVAQPGFHPDPVKFARALFVEAARKCESGVLEASC